MRRFGSDASSIGCHWPRGCHWRQLWVASALPLDDRRNLQTRSQGHHNYDRNADHTPRTLASQSSRQWHSIRKTEWLSGLGA